MTDRLVHFHFGVGKIGLGLVVPFFTRSSVFPLVPLARRVSHRDHYSRLASERAYVLHSYDTNESSEIQLGSLERYDDQPGGMAALVARHGLPAIVSCSVGEANVAALYPLVIALIRANVNHYRRHPLIFLPFENSTRAATGLREFIDTIDRKLTRMVFPLDMVIDKICARVDASLSPCPVVVESFEEFYLSSLDWDAPPLAVANTLAAAGLQPHYLERPLFEFQKRKKTWMINGLHYCIAVSAYELSLGSATVADAMENPVVAEHANAFVSDVLFALLALSKSNSPALHPNALHLREYAELALTRMRLSRFDETSRILPAIQFLVEELDLMSLRERTISSPPPFGAFYQKWTDRVLEPTRALLLHHRAYQDRPIYLPELTNSLLRLLSETIPDLEAYAVEHVRARRRQTPL